MSSIPTPMHTVQGKRPTPSEDAISLSRRQHAHSLDWIYRKLLYPKPKIEATSIGGSQRKTAQAHFHSQPVSSHSSDVTNFLFECSQEKVVLKGRTSASISSVPTSRSIDYPQPLTPHHSMDATLMNDWIFSARSANQG